MRYGARLGDQRVSETFPATRKRTRDSAPDVRLPGCDPKLTPHPHQRRLVIAPEKTEIPSMPQGMSQSLVGAEIPGCAPSQSKVDNARSDYLYAIGGRRRRRRS